MPCCPCTFLASEYVTDLSDVGYFHIYLGLFCVSLYGNRNMADIFVVTIAVLSCKGASCLSSAVIVLAVTFLTVTVLGFVTYSKTLWKFSFFAV